MSGHLLEARGVEKHFFVRRGLRRATLRAVDGVSLHVDAGETLGLVGESGCGKTTLGRTLLRLYEPTGGEVFFDGVRVDAKSIRALRRQMQMVFQDPYSSLDPRMTAEELIGEALQIHHLCPTRAARRARVEELMALTGLDPAHARRYAHAFSGGQRQRIGIARALAVGARFLVCDEPVSALDASVRAQVLNTLMELQDTLGIAYLFISHDLAVVSRLSHRIAVMYLGRIVEIGTAQQIAQAPLHPYTRALLAAAPPPDPVRARAQAAACPTGEAPSPLNAPQGCAFRPRCALATERCARERPELSPLEGGRLVACHACMTSRARG